jgi:hypothetical protein
MNAAVQPLGKDRALGREPPSEPGTKAYDLHHQGVTRLMTWTPLRGVRLSISNRRTSAAARSFSSRPSIVAALMAECSSTASDSVTSWSYPLERRHRG